MVANDVEEQMMETLAFGQSVEDWLAAFPVSDARAKLDRLKEQRASLDGEIAQLERLIEALAGQDEPAPVRSSNGVTHLNGKRYLPSAAVPQGMDAVEIVMHERPGVWARHEIGAALVARGWLAQGEKGTGTLGSIMYRMVQRGRVVRLDGGRYKLPAVEPEVDHVA